MSEQSDKPLNTLPGPESGASGSTGIDERRTSIRYPFTAAATVLDVHSQTRVVGRIGDLGAGGCYIDTLSPFSAATAVRVSLNRGKQQFEALATVTYSMQSMGMGLAFTEIKPEYRAVLEKWIAELNGEDSPEHEEIEEVFAETGTLTGIGTLRQVLNELINLMMRRKIISEKEGADLLRQMFH